MTPKWLKDYYGKNFDSFKPEVFLDGNKFAVVKISGQADKSLGHSNIGYILVNKSGRFGATPHRPLYEGVAGALQLQLMKQALATTDK